MTGNQDDEFDSWLKLHPGVRDVLLDEAEKTFDPALHDSVAAHFETLARAKFRETEEDAQKFRATYEAGQMVDICTGRIFTEV